MAGGGGGGRYIYPDMIRDVLLRSEMKTWRFRLYFQLRNSGEQSRTRNTLGPLATADRRDGARLFSVKHGIVI